MIPAFPQHTKIFKGEYKTTLLRRLELDRPSPQDSLPERPTNIRHEIFGALTDWKIWLATLTYMGTQENISSIVAFLPSILRGMGYTSVSAQVHTIPIYCVALALTLTCAWLAEKMQQRYLFALFGALLNLTGLSIQLAQPESVGVRYMGTFFMTAGCYVVMPIVVVWNAINVRRGHRRVVGFAMTTAVGNCGALISSNVYITAEEPGYRTGKSENSGAWRLKVLTMLDRFLSWYSVQLPFDRVDDCAVCWVAACE